MDKEELQAWTQFLAGAIAGLRAWCTGGAPEEIVEEAEEYANVALELWRERRKNNERP